MADSIPASRDEAYAAGRQARIDGTAPLHDLTTHLKTIGLPAEFHGQWLAGLEDEMEAEGLNVEGNEGDGYDWERNALAAVYANA